MHHHMLHDDRPHRRLVEELTNDADFAAADTVTESAKVYLDLALEVLADHFPEAASLTRALASVPAARSRRLLRSPALRCAIYGLLAALPSLFERGGPAAFSAGELLDQTSDLREVLCDAADALAAPPDPAVLLEGDALPLPLGRRPGEAASGFRLWCPRTPAGPSQRLLIRQFDRTIRAETAGAPGPPGPDCVGIAGGISIGTGSEAQAEVLGEAIGLLTATVPELTGSLARHVYLVALMHGEHRDRGRVLSASDSSIPGALFLSAAAAEDRLAAAEALLHEATHQRLYDLMLCRQLYAGDYSPRTSPRLTPPWYEDESDGGPSWHADRVLAAFHVYVHLAALWSAALDVREADGVLGPADRPAVAARLRRCLDRGDYLLGRLRESMRPAFGPDGLRFIRFLARAFADIDRSVIPAEPAFEPTSRWETA
jgi:hypothetical protein